MKTFVIRPLAALLLTACAASIADAQVIISNEQERALRYRNSMPYDGESTTQRYSYNPGAIFYLNGSWRNYAYLDYLDRLDRAEKFGYPIPVDPFLEVIPAPEEGEFVAPPPRPIRAGLGWGIFRRR